MKKLQEKLADATLRMDRVIILAGALVDADSPADEFDNFISYGSDLETLQRLFPDAPRYVLDEDNEDEWFDLLCEWLCESGTLGYLVQFATPVMRPLTNTVRSFSWGHYNTRWEYAETLNAVVAKGLAWAAEIRAEEDKEAALSSAKGGAV